MAEFVINDDNWMLFVNPVVDDEVKVCGTVPRDFMRCPVGYIPHAKPFDLPVFSDSEIAERVRVLTEAKANNSDIRERGVDGSRIPSRDQNSIGYCWCHSGVSAHLIARAKMNQPYADLSAFAIGCMIKQYRDEGGWGSEGVEFQGERGVPTSQFWPQKSRDRSNDKPETWADAAKHKMLQWYDLDPQQMREQFLTCLALGWPVVVDYNWWSHSVCALEIVQLEPLRIRIWNSWGDSWSENGTGLLEGRKAMPDGAVACVCVEA